MKKGNYYSPKHDKNFDVEIIKESKRYYWIKIFNSVQRKRKGLISKL